MKTLGIIICCLAGATWLIGAGILWPLRIRKRIQSDPDISSFRKFLWFWCWPKGKEWLWLLILLAVVSCLFYIGGLLTGEITFISLTNRSTRTLPLRVTFPTMRPDSSSPLNAPLR